MITEPKRIYNFALFLTLFISTSAISESLIVQKQKFSLKNYTTTNGSELPIVEVGWESYGQLNEEKDNAILITHHFTATSHAAGKYSPDDARAGYWDSIIGPGKAIDTNKFFVLSSDTLVNANVHLPHVITTGPASINPQTQKPYGLDFPVVTIRDFVNVQNALVKSLGIKKLHAIVGASMGSHQALEWASAFPDEVDRVISIIGIGESDSWKKANIESWAAPIKEDPLWNKGNYYDSEPPLDGLQRSLASIILFAHHGYIFDRRFKEKMNIDRAPSESVINDFEVTSWIKKAAAKRAPTVDANHILYLTRACQLFRIGHKSSLALGIAPIKAKIMLFPAKNDVLLAKYNMEKLYTEMLMQKKDVTYEEIEGPWGHLDGIYAIGVKATKIRNFLEND